MELLGVYYTSLDIESKYAEDLTATLIGWQLLAVTKKERVAELKASDSISDVSEDAEIETIDCITDPVELVSKESKT